MTSSLACAGCGAELPGEAPPPWRCPRVNAEPETDHVVARRLELAGTRWPADDGERNPFVRWRELLHSYRSARRAGASDGDWVALARELDGRVAEVDGRGFAETPLVRSDALARALGVGAVWVKDETGNVTGTHKGRHLFGIALALLASERFAGALPAERLAIASCGNAALAAAAVARALDRPLDAFVPPDADPEVARRLRAHGARLVPCPRRTGLPPGDPCVAALRAAVREGAVPFTVQGSENGLAVEGGHTLAWELASTLAAAGARPTRLLVQVGGGALASACAAGLAEARALGALDALPRLHPVQAEGCHPLARAWRRLARELLARSGGAPSEDASDAELAALLAERVSGEAIAAALARAARRRNELMEPWPETPRSAADAILDDETYDWLAVCRGALDTGGSPVVVPEELVLRARDLAREALGADASPTGTAGLAGALALEAAGELRADDELVLLLTGKAR